MTTQTETEPQTDDINIIGQDLTIRFGKLISTPEGNAMAQLYRVWVEGFEIMNPNFSDWCQKRSADFEKLAKAGINLPGTCCLKKNYILTFFDKAGILTNECKRIFQHLLFGVNTTRNKTVSTLRTSMKEYEATDLIDLHSSTAD